MLLVDICSPKSSSDRIQTTSYKCALESFFWVIFYSFQRDIGWEEPMDINLFEQYLAWELCAKNLDMSKTETKPPTIQM